MVEFGRHPGPEKPGAREGVKVRLLPMIWYIAGNDATGRHDALKMHILWVQIPFSRIKSSLIGRTSDSESERCEFESYLLNNADNRFVNGIS